MHKALQSIILALLVFTTSLAHADPFRDGVVAYQQKKYQQALNAWLPLAESGHVLAQTLVGSMYAYGEGVEKNDKEAFKWLSRAANTGSAQAQFNLGILYEKGFGITADKQQARKWFKAAADQGREDAAERYALLTKEINATPSQDSNKTIIKENESNIAIKDTSTETGAPRKRINVALNSDDSELLGPPGYSQATPVLTNEQYGATWASQQPTDNYTIQLAASIEPRLIDAFKKHIKLTTQYAETSSIHNGKQWHTIIYGSYPSVREAKHAISQFPDSWKTWRPWIKQFSSVKTIKNN